MKTKLYLIATFAVLFLSGVASLNFSPAASAQTGASVHLISTAGTLNATGQYTQSFGSFVRLAEGTPVPTPTPNPTPTPTPNPTPTPCVPIPGSPGGDVYFGVYTLSNNESGTFVFLVQSADGASSGTGLPSDIPENPVIVEQGAATITLQIHIAAGTGSGTISFSSNGGPVTGNIIITEKFPVPPTEPVTCGNTTPTPTPVASPTPTPGTVEVSGRVTTPAGLGIANAVVTITDSVGVRSTARTSSFGIYRFDRVRVNEAYIVSVASKRYRFASQLVPVAGAVNDLNFTGLE